MTQWFVYRRLPDNSGRVVTVHDSWDEAVDVARALVALGAGSSQMTYEVWERDLLEKFCGPQAPPTDATHLRGDDGFGPIWDGIPREHLS